MVVVGCGRVVWATVLGGTVAFVVGLTEAAALDGFELLLPTAAPMTPRSTKVTTTHDAICPTTGQPLNRRQGFGRGVATSAGSEGPI